VNLCSASRPKRVAYFKKTWREQDHADVSAVKAVN